MTTSEKIKQTIIFTLKVLPWLIIVMLLFKPVVY